MAIPGDVPFPIPVGLPTDACSEFDWPKLYLSAAVNYAWQRLYDNYDGIRDSFIAQWVKIVSIFKSSQNLLGYDLINEPWAGDTIEKPNRLVPQGKKTIRFKNRKKNCAQPFILYYG